MMTTIDRITVFGLERYATRNEMPVAVSLWLCQMVSAAAADDRLAAWDDMAASAPLHPADVHYLTSLYDAIQAGEETETHEHVDWTDVEPGNEFVSACEQILYRRALEFLAAPWNHYSR